MQTADIQCVASSALCTPAALLPLCVCVCMHACLCVLLPHASLAADNVGLNWHVPVTYLCSSSQLASVLPQVLLIFLLPPNFSWT